MAKPAYDETQEENIINALAHVKTYSEQSEILTALAAEMGKKPASIVAKASSLAKNGKCIYITKSAPKREKGGNVEKKAEKVARIVEQIGGNIELFDSLEKATVYVLDSLLKGLDA